MICHILNIVYDMYVDRLTRELQLPIRNHRFDSVGNRTQASQTRSERSNHSATELVNRTNINLVKIKAMGIAGGTGDKLWIDDTNEDTMLHFY